MTVCEDFLELISQQIGDDENNPKLLVFTICCEPSDREAAKTRLHVATNMDLLDLRELLTRAVGELVKNELAVAKPRYLKPSC